NPALVEGARGTAPATALPSSDAWIWFSSQYQSTYGVDPLTVVDVANVFDATMLLELSAASALTQKKKLDGTSLAFALTRVSDPGAPEVIALDPPNFNKASNAFLSGALNIDGASGHLDFDSKSGEAPANIEVWRVENGAFVTEKIVAP